ncbi:MAG: DUF308 domain-containing protein [Oscillospiraceae bacterium]|nr:DUF308 domain-containing protein [Oscillospiraceae bacterium]
MNKDRIIHLLRLYAGPALLALAGLLLLFSPDTASALIAKAVGWIAIIAGAAGLLRGVLGAAPDRTRAIVGAVICLGLGIFVVSFPMVLADTLGRFLGIFLVCFGASGVRQALQKRDADLPYRDSLIVAGVTLAAGILLFLLPRTLSRIILNICGVVLIVIGVVNALGTYREQKAIEDGSHRPDIIDADE